MVLQNGFELEEKLGQFVIQVPTVLSSDLGETAKEIFDNLVEVEGIVVMEHGSPVGIIMRTVFFQKMSSLYGHSLYMKRPVSLLMDSTFMSADAGDSISQVGLTSTNRDHDKLYDYIVVYKNRNYLGVISIRMFLAELSKRNEAQISVLKEQQQKLMSAHEQELQLRKNLEYQSAAVRNLLDHAEQGFLWFGKDLIIKNEVSYKCVELFGKGIGGERFSDLVSDYFTADQAQIFDMAFDSYFQNNTPVTDAVYLMLLPSDCVIAGKNVHMQYRRIESNKEKAVMVVMNDITEKVELEQAMEDDRYQQRLLIKAFGCQPQIKRMIEEFRELFSGGFKSFFADSAKFRDSLDDLFRSVHTYKGDFAQYGFDSAAEKLHGFEDELNQLIQRSGEVGMHELEALIARIDPDEILRDDLQVLYNFLGKDYFDQSEVISVPKSRLHAMEAQLQTGADMTKAELIKMLRSLQLKNVKSYLSQYKDYTAYLCGRVMKSEPVYLVEGDDVEIDGDCYERFFQSLVHIFRNIMDHGIETDEERVEAGKNQFGLIRCYVAAGNDRCFTISISDDGQGLNLDKLKTRAMEKGIFTGDELDEMPENEICNLVFADHISTKEAVDSLSGRGVGMSAVREACLKLGGDIAIETQAGKGTTFIMTIPYSPALNP